MSGPNAAQVDRARRLLAHEGAGGRDRAKSPAGRVYDKLRAELATLVGSESALLLFLRSAKLAQGEFDWLAKVPAPERSTKLRESLDAQEPSMATESAAVLFGSFFTLVATLIGERLTAQVLRSAWPAFEETAPTENKQ